jgi:DNA-binding transcriptional MerR regulator
MNRGIDIMEENIVSLILQMRNSGYNNDQIIQQLQSQGFGSVEIYDGMNQAAMSSAEPVIEETQMFPENQSYDIAQAPVENLQMSSIRDEIEATAESIIEEKWAEFEDSVKRILDWKAEVETKIEGFVKQLDDLKQDVTNLQKGIYGKINEYDKSIVNVGTDLKSLEKVFKDILPTFTENVQELSRVTTKLKK